uniref:Uncharacterized protein n=1 Tax=Zea mays TaxID=4577 RepID=A0A804MI63_MAIZE
MKRKRSFKRQKAKLVIESLKFYCMTMMKRRQHCRELPKLNVRQNRLYKELFDCATRSNSHDKHRAHNIQIYHGSQDYRGC